MSDVHCRQSLVHVYNALTVRKEYIQWISEDRISLSLFIVDDD